MADDGARSPRGLKRKADEETPAPSSGPKRIQALDPNVINKIAAGEIIIAPVHALKELIENSVDAGSTMLEVVVKDGGLKMLQITDNGSGIDKDDLPILCQRFTTSKLQKFEDLESIATYGFRGEALASISYIARVTITTRTKASDLAWRGYYESGELAPPKPGQSAEPRRVAGRQGTQIMVEDLFYNVPTRRRAFRSTADEYNKIVDMLGRYAVHCSHVGFSCKKHGESSASVSIPASSSTVDRIRHVYGGAVAGELIEFSTSDGRWGFTATGWASNANYSMKRTTLLLFINGRCVESTNIRKALEEAYAAFLPKNSHPFIYLSLVIDPQRVDVNVHPTKREVNFLNEDEITAAICTHISAKLADVDASRTFPTQTLLPGTAIGTGGGSSPVPSTPRVTLLGSARKTTRPHENNLVRTDTNLRKITSMFGPTQPQATPGPDTPGGPGGAVDGLSVRMPQGPLGDMEYETVDRDVSVNWLKSVRELKEAVVAASSDELTDIFKNYSFVGVVDERRRLAAIQSGVKLFLVDYGRACFELFYQLGLDDFGNFGTIRFNPPLDLRQLLCIALETEPSDTDTDVEAVEAVAAQLVERRQMLQEYFSLDITPGGELLGLPLLTKGYMPPLAKLPQFLLRLGPRVRWNDEKACFDTFLRELASFYVPEKLPVFNEELHRHRQAQALEKAKAKAGDPDTGLDDGEDGEDDETRARRKHIHQALEHVLFPAFKSQLICTSSLLDAGLMEVANLKGLYRVFERC